MDRRRRQLSRHTPRQLSRHTRSGATGTQRSRTSRAALGAGIAAMVLTLAAPAAQADEYEADRAGHPVRVLAYLLHPFGVALDYLVFRPAHWVGHQEPFKTLFGHEDH